MIYRATLRLDIGDERRVHASLGRHRFGSSELEVMDRSRRPRNDGAVKLYLLDGGFVCVSGLHALSVSARQKRHMGIQTSERFARHIHVLTGALAARGVALHHVVDEEIRGSLVGRTVRLPHPRSS